MEDPTSQFVLTNGLNYNYRLKPTHPLSVNFQGFHKSAALSIHFFFWFVVMEIKSWSLYMLGKHSSGDPHPWPLYGLVVTITNLECLNSQVSTLVTTNFDCHLGWINRHVGRQGVSVTAFPVSTEGKKPVLNVSSTIPWVRIADRTQRGKGEWEPSSGFMLAGSFLICPDVSSLHNHSCERFQPPRFPTMKNAMVLSVNLTQVRITREMDL